MTLSMVISVLEWLSGSPPKTSTAETVSQAIAIAETADNSAIANAFAAIEFKATADGIDNSGGEITNNRGGK